MILLNKMDLIRFLILYIFFIYIHIGIESVTLKQQINDDCSKSEQKM